MRANGQVRFLRISAKLQRRVAGSAAVVVGAWLVITLGMAVNQVSISFERMALVSKQEKIQSAEERLAKYKGGIDEVTEDLTKRQDMLDTLYKEHFGEEAKAAEKAAATSEEEKKADKISKIMPMAAGLARIEARQIIFAEELTKIAVKRALRAEAAIRQYGLNPKMLAGESTDAQGGPFIPFFGKREASIGDPRFDKLAAALDRMNRMESSLNSIPTAMPAAVMNMSSNYGYRRDPFTGGGAMHSGIDFKGPHGSAILAAADGRVTFAGRQGGYGNCLEITHANGLVTRYAHLSGFNVREGQKVSRGFRIASMGSTGRSTGTHLHFEVRLNGQAVNPMKFLEFNSDVLEVKTVNRNSTSAKGS